MRNAIRFLLAWIGLPVVITIILICILGDYLTDGPNVTEDFFDDWGRWALLWQ